MNKAERSTMYCEYLKREGYRPIVDEEGDVMFKHEGRTFFLLIDNEDDIYFRLVLPGIFSCDKEEDRPGVEHACMMATAKTKVAAAYLQDTQVWVSAELLISPPTAFENVFQRSLGIVDAGARNFADAFREWLANHV